jgi:pyruvate-formate lyase-activating enzyme
LEAKTALEELDCLFEQRDKGVWVAADVIECFSDGGEDLSGIAEFVNDPVKTRDRRLTI